MHNALQYKCISKPMGRNGGWPDVGETFSLVVADVRRLIVNSELKEGERTRPGCLISAAIFRRWPKPVKTIKMSCCSINTAD